MSAGGEVEGKQEAVAQKDRGVNLEMSKAAGWNREEMGYVPVKSHIRVLEPILSPNRPMEAPARKPSREHNACWSGL